MALLDLDQAKEQLDLLSGEDDEELLVFINGLTAVIERHTGPVEVREVVEMIEGRGISMCLTHIPALALVSVAPTMTAGDALNLDDLVLDAKKGVVYRKGGAFAGTLWTVTYTAGRPVVPPTITLAARLLLAHMWRTKNGSGRGPADDFSVSDPDPSLGYAVPTRVLQLLDPFKLPPGVA